MNNMGSIKKRIIFGFCFLFLFLNVSLISSMSDQSICINIYSFLATHNGSYSLIDIQNLNNQFGINNSEDYIVNFGGKCLQYFNGVLNSSFLDSYSNYNQTCNLTFTSFFETPFNIKGSIYLGDYSCSTERTLNYFIQTDNGYLTGIRAWTIIPIIAIVFIIYWFLEWIVRKIRKK